MHCYVCQAPITEDERFCPSCGQPIPWSRPDDAILSDFDVQAFTELRAEKARLAGELEGLLEQAGERELTSDEREQWAHLYGQWKEATDEVTRQMERFWQRVEGDRRARDNRGAERRMRDAEIDIPDRRTGAERREIERRSGIDRRDPYGDFDRNGNAD